MWKLHEGAVCFCGDRLDLAGPRSNRSGDTFLANLEMAIMTRKVAALFIDFAYLACAIFVALHPRGLWDIGTFLVFLFLFWPASPIVWPLVALH